MDTHLCLACGMNTPDLVQKILQIDRGYEEIDARMNSLGASIRRDS